MKREYEEGHTGWFVNTETGTAHLLHIGWFGGDRLNEWYLKCGGPICPAGGDRIGRKCHGPKEPWVDRRDIEPKEVCEECRRKEERR